MDNLTIVQEKENVITNAPFDNKLLAKLKSKFTNNEQQLFVQNFYMYLNHDEYKEYIVDLDSVWEWLGFSTKQKAKELLVKHFVKDIDYKNLLNPQVKQYTDQQRGGHNKETIVMNIRTFKKLCLKANTKKANEIHDYYITMERILHEYMLENALAQQRLVREKTLIENFNMKSVNYLGVIGEIDGETLGKFGYSNDINQRVKDHKKEIGEEFVLETIVDCDKNIDLERKFKQHPEIINRRVKKMINGKVQTELVKLDDTFGPDDIKKIFISLKQTMSVDSELLRMKHEERMLELNIQLKQLELEMKKLEVQQGQRNSNHVSARQRENQKSVLQYDLDGNLIKEFKSIAAAAREVCGNRNTLSAHCGKQKHYMNFYWKYN